MPTIRPCHTCRICGSRDLDLLLPLGDFAISTFPAPGDPPPPRAPLHLAICTICDLVQLSHSVSGEDLFRQYWYKSGINEAMRAELGDIVEQASARVGGLSSHDIVIDIGANDGTLLAKVGADGPCRIAFEPARNLTHELRQHAEVTISDFFPNGLSRVGIVKAQLITSIAMFYDLDDPHSFVAAIRTYLAAAGVWVVQFQDLLQMVETCAIDNTVHEHVTYLTLKDMQTLVEAHGLEIVDAERRKINGGSLRLYVRHQGVQAISPRVQTLRALEANLYDKLLTFGWQVGEMKKQIWATLDEAAKMGPIDVYAVSTKFNTLSQLLGLGPDIIRHGVERTAEKWGRLSVTGIPIVSEAEWRADPAPTTLIGAWQFKEAILLREAAYLAGGGHFLVPLPRPEIVYAKVGGLEMIQ